jgi:REP element-mobilizing transposase RayT
MSHAYARNYIHVVFSTRQRQKAIPAELQPNLWAYLRGIAKNYQIDLLAIGGVDDHVHLLLALPPKLSLADALRALKANSSKWMNESGQHFSWQDGYGAFSVSTSNLESVRGYIQNQGNTTRSGRLRKNSWLS